MSGNVLMLALPQFGVEHQRGEHPLRVAWVRAVRRSGPAGVDEGLAQRSNSIRLTNRGCATIERRGAALTDRKKHHDHGSAYRQGDSTSCLHSSPPSPPRARPIRARTVTPSPMSSPSCRQVRRGVSRSGARRPATPAANLPGGGARDRFGPMTAVPRTQERESPSGSSFVCSRGACLDDDRPSPRAGRQDPSFRLASHESGPRSPRPAGRRLPGGAFEAPRRDGARLAFCLVQALSSVRMAEDRRPDGLAGNF